MQPASVNDAGPEEMAGLRAEFPDYLISLETVRDRIRYVARRQRATVNPHTVVTADLAELRMLLGGVPRQSQSADGRSCGGGAPNIARMYDRWLGGKDSLTADRFAADAVLADFPAVARVAQANREFVVRAVAHVAARGIAQFIDIGAGLPTTPSVHQIARHADASARVAYVDNDPVVLAHARALLVDGPGVVVVHADMRQPDAILTAPDLADLIDLGQPVCLLLASVLHFATAAEADAIVPAFVAAMAPGSYLILSAGTSTGTDPALIDRLQVAYAGTAVVTGRTEAEIAGYFTGLHLVPPGLTDVGAWRPDHWGGQPTPGARILGAVGRKQAPRTALANRVRSQ